MFIACSFWMVSALEALRTRQEAASLFERLLTLRNDVGLLSEEYDHGAKRQVGNFPQALSHIALVNSAFEFMSEQPRRTARPVEGRKAT